MNLGWVALIEIKKKNTDGGKKNLYCVLGEVRKKSKEKVG